MDSPVSPAPEPLWDPEAIPAATVIPLRDGAEGLEVLMLRRDESLAFAGGMWVFPGGRIDPEDRTEPGEGPEALEVAARNAALREATEEAAVVLEPATVRRWSHWTPPARPRSEGLLSRRFTTAFFVGVAIGDTDAVVVDDGEIREHRWVSPAAMSEQHAEGEVTLAPPTWVTLQQLAVHRNPAEVLMAAPRTLDEVVHYATRVGVIEDGWVALYHGDVAYEGGEVDAPGPRHRIHMDSLPWRYEVDDGTAAEDAESPP